MNNQSNSLFSSQENDHNCAETEEDIMQILVASDVNLGFEKAVKRGK